MSASTNFDDLMTFDSEYLWLMKFNPLDGFMSDAEMDDYLDELNYIHN